MKWVDLLCSNAPCLLAAGALLLTLAAASWGAERPAEPALVRAADALLRFQAPDGALAMAPIPAKDEPPDEPQRVIPYFASLGAQGLVAAFRETDDARYRDAARRWAAWYERHMNPDGTVFDHTGAPGAWKGTGDYDSTDSYAATYLELVRDLHVAAPDAAWLRARRPFLRRAAAAIRLTMQPNGLTLAKPKWPVMYTMDNTETARGLRAGAELARALGDEEEAATLAAEARRMEEGLDRDLWDEARNCYRVGVQPDGGKMEGLETWYPDVMANLMAVGWRPASARNKALFARLRTRFGKDIPEQVRTAQDVEVLVWWAYAARGAGDRRFERTLRARLRDGAKTFDAIGNPATLGHVLRLLADPA